MATLTLPNEIQNTSVGQQVSPEARPLRDDFADHGEETGSRLYPIDSDFTAIADINPIRHDRPTTFPPCSKASGRAVLAIIVNMAPPHSPSIPTWMRMLLRFSPEPGGKVRAPKAAPKPVPTKMVPHIARMVTVFTPQAFIVPDEDMASGKLAKNTPITKVSNELLSAPLDRIPSTKLSGIPSMRMPSQIMMAAVLPPWWLWRLEISSWIISSSPTCSIILSLRASQGSAVDVIFRAIVTAGAFDCTQAVLGLPPTGVPMGFHPCSAKDLYPGRASVMVAVRVRSPTPSQEGLLPMLASRTGFPAERFRRTIGTSELCSWPSAGTTPTTPGTSTSGRATSGGSAPPVPPPVPATGSVHPTETPELTRGGRAGSVPRLSPL
mmetsp:Transcript_41313/g.93455  ORF Transcript_41313/g.93455 Transcript_41313/m.93455 type:complete len:380 (-) Transcript_41313:1234-2373(-)